MSAIRLSTCALVGLLLASAGCELLEEEVFSAQPPEESLRTERGVNSVVVSAYSHLSLVGPAQRDVHIVMEELTSDILTETGGGLERDVRPFMDFTWDAEHRFFRDYWADCYEAIRDANLVLDHLPTALIPADRRRLYEAEARFIRSKAYLELYNLFGPVPLVTSARAGAVALPRATDEQIHNFIEAEMRLAADRLPLVAEQYGRATRGAALAFLTRFLLNTRQWQKAAAAAQATIDLGVYQLVDDRWAMFEVANERNSEFIHVSPALPLTGLGNFYLPHVIPPGYVFKHPPKADFGAEFRTPWSFVSSFHPADERLRHFLIRHVDNRGQLVDFSPRFAYSHKYHEDPQSRDLNAGNDIVEMRYADVLLSRAEALNEMEGPTREAIDLVNQVRRAAGVPPLEPSAFPTREALRNHLLQERGWEFYTEGKRRQDLVRHDRFIEQAVARGRPAQPFHVRFPIPQAEIDANPNLRQNPGY